MKRYEVMEHSGCRDAQRLKSELDLIAMRWSDCRLVSVITGEMGMTSVFPGVFSIWEVPDE